MNKMYFVILLVVVCSGYICFAESELTWYDANELRIDGRGWENTPTPYCRLPVTVENDVPESVWVLSKQSAGLIVHFNTNSSKIDFQWALTGPLYMSHMPATGVSGLDLYQKSDEGTWNFAYNGRPDKSENQITAFVSNPEGKVRKYKLYLPLYNGLKTLKIGVPKEASFCQPPASKKKPIVYYGTSITQGACASRPGMAYTAMLDRMLDWPIVNLGFSGSGKMEPEVAQTIAEIDAELYVIDCLWNLVSNEEIEQRTAKLIKIIRNKHADTPILFVGQSYIGQVFPGVRTEAMLKAFKESVDAGVKGLHFQEGDDLVGDDWDGTVDGCHPNDLGMRRHADVLAPVIQKLIGK